MEASKRGRPSTGAAKTPAQRQQASRAARLAQRHESFPARQVSTMLSPQAAQALDILAFNRDLSQKAIIEELLIQAYEGLKIKM